MDETDKQWLESNNAIIRTFIANSFQHHAARNHIADYPVCQNPICEMGHSLEEKMNGLRIRDGEIVLSELEAIARGANLMIIAADQPEHANLSPMQCLWVIRAFLSKD